MVTRRQLLVALGLTGCILTTSAHLGSPDTWFQGNAGPYPVRVVVRLPGVVPGLAQIDITVAGEGVETVTAQPVIFDAGKNGAPPADVAKPVPGRPGTYHAQLWFMTVGSFSVRIGVKGSQGEGVASVPVAAVATTQIPLYPWLGKLLAALGIFLFIGAVTILRAAATDGVTTPGAALDPARRRTGLVAASVGAVLLSVGLYGGKSWWDAVAREYRDAIYRPFSAAAKVEIIDGRRTLRFAITDSIWANDLAVRRWQRFAVTPLVPDHGKLMHLFLVRQGDQGAFAHLHPVSTDSVTFLAGLGDLPAGQYHAYADVVHETGFPQTMVATVEVPAATLDTIHFTDYEDATFVGEPTGDTFRLPDGGSITWVGKPASLTADQDAGLSFVVKEADGSTARLGPYLGMPAHAVVQRDDGSVYIHLHPSGTISMVAQAALGARQETDTLPGMLARRLTEDTAAAILHTDHPMFDGSFSFPYAFPKPGRYRVWVQIRRSGNIVTAPFAVEVR